MSLVEQAIPPRSPVRPRKAQLAGLGLLAGLLLGVGLVFGRDYLDNTLKDPDEVERYLHLDVLAAVPRYEDRDRTWRPRPTRTCAPPSSSAAARKGARWCSSPAPRPRRARPPPW